MTGGCTTLTTVPALHNVEPPVKAKVHFLLSAKLLSFIIRGILEDHMKVDSKTRQLFTDLRLLEIPGNLANY